MGIGPVPRGAQRTRFLAVGCADNTVRVVSLDPGDCLQPLAMQAPPARPESLCIAEVCVCVFVFVFIFREGILATLSYSGVLQPVRVCVCV